MSKKKKDGSADQAEGVKFETAIEQIEQVIEKIESGQTGLEQSLEAYGRATELIGHCRRILKKAEVRIAELSLDGEGGLKLSQDSDAGSDGP